MHPYYVIRATGGVLFLTGALLMVYNIVKTVRSGEPVNEPVAAPLGTTAARVQAAE
jgi:cytochrome c oxidase cbb3-type subunit 1